MIHLTTQEKQVLFLIVAVCVFGLMTHYALNFWPAARNAVDFIDRQEIQFLKIAQNEHKQNQ